MRFYRATVSAGDRATLVWNRRVVGAADQTAVPQALTLSNLDLYEYDGAQSQQAASTSSIDNVEQVRGVSPGTVVYKVKDESSTVDGAAGEPFALAARNPLTPLATPTPTVTLTLDRNSTRQDADVTVTETVHNPSADIPGSSATASLSLPDGVAVSSGGPTTWSPGAGTIAPNATVSHQWTVRGTADGVHQLGATAQDAAYDETFTGSDDASLLVDSTAPTPSISCPASGGTDPRLAIAWSATDASAVQSYDVDMSTDGGPYAPWLAATSQTSAILAGRPGGSYELRVRAADKLGNLSGYAACGPVVIGYSALPPSAPLPAPTKLLPAAPHLKLVKLRVRRRRLLIEGRLAARATGSVNCSFSVHGRRPIRTRTRVVHGRYRALLRLPRGRARGLLRIQYSGDRSFAPQHISRRIK